MSDGIAFLIEKIDRTNYCVHVLVLASYAAVSCSETLLRVERVIT